MTDWIEHNGGPQPVGNDVWVERFDRGYGLAGNPKWHWSKPVFYRILNQHLIDAKQAEIDALRGQRLAEAQKLADQRHDQYMLAAANVVRIRNALEDLLMEVKP